MAENTQHPKPVVRRRNRSCWIESLCQGSTGNRRQVGVDLNQDNGTGRVQRISGGGLVNSCNHIVPWLNKLPGDIIRARVRLTMQPLDGPPDAAGLAAVLEQLGSEDMLLFASDYPHWQYDGDDVVPAGIPAGMLRKMMIDNALATYPRLRAA